MRGDSDRELVVRSLEGDDRAFRELVERHTPLVYAVVRGIMGNHPEAEDTVQEIFIKVFKGLGRFRGNSRLATWIYRISRNEAINASSRSRPETGPLDEARYISTDDAGPDKVYERKRLRAGLERLMAGLEENYRIVLELRYMGEKTYNEIADIMDIPVGTVKTNLHRAKQSLKRILVSKQAAGNRKDR